MRQLLLQMSASVSLSLVVSCSGDPNEVLPINKKVNANNKPTKADLIPINSSYSLTASCTKTMKPTRMFPPLDTKTPESGIRARQAFLDLAHMGKITWCVEEFVDPKISEAEKHRLISQISSSCKSDETSTNPKLSLEKKCLPPETGEQVLIKSTVSGVTKYGRVTISILTASAEQKSRLKDGWPLIGLKTSNLGLQRLTEDLKQ